MVSNYTSQANAGRDLEESLLRAINSGALKGGDTLESTPALAKRFGISLVTAQKTLKKLGDAGYLQRKNGAPTTVAMRSSRTIGLILPNMGNRFTLEASEFHYRTVSGILSACNEHGFNMNIVHTPHNAMDPRNLDSMGLHGLLVLYPRRQNCALLESLQASGLPLVCVNLLDEELREKYHCINFNYQGAGQRAWEYFRQRGRRRPVFCARLPLLSDQHRLHLWNGFRQAAADDGVTARLLEIGDQAHALSDSVLMPAKRTEIECFLKDADAVLFGETAEAELYRAWGHMVTDLVGFFAVSQYFPAFTLNCSQVGSSALEMLLQCGMTSTPGPQLQYIDPEIIFPAKYL